MCPAFDAALSKVMVSIIEDAVTIGTSVAEGVDGRATETLRRPRCRLCGYHKVVVIEAKFGIRINEINVRWDDASFQSEDSLNQAC